MLVNSFSLDAIWLKRIWSNLLKNGYHQHRLEWTRIRSSERTHCNKTNDFASCVYLKMWADWCTSNLLRFWGERGDEDAGVLKMIKCVTHPEH
jgi:hypothetical protein